MSSDATGSDETSEPSDGFQPCPAADPCKVLPLGDSITEGMRRTGSGYEFNGGYRVPLFELAVADGKNITFVGSRSNGPDTVAGKPFPKAHEGTSGIKTAALAMASNKYKDGPHIVLLHIGTNDMQGPVDDAVDALDTFLDQIIEEVPDALLVVAQVIPLSGSQAVQTFNAAIPAMVEERASAGAHIIMVDQFTNFPEAELGDGVHPSLEGYERMAGVWYDAIESYLP